jgi:hypothetical protein
VGREFAPHSNHGLHVGVCGCECVSMLATLFPYHVPVFLSDLNYGFKSLFSEQKIVYQTVTQKINCSLGGRVESARPRLMQMSSRSPLNFRRRPEL